MVGISLRNSMKLGKFSECEVVAGSDGLDRIIENITIMEVPDIVQWLKGRELILTSLFAIQDDKDAQNLLIQRLYYAGATALAIKPFETMDEIPEGIIENANKLGFPVIQIPEHVKYLDILSPIMHHIFNDKVVLQEDIEQATNVLQEISLSSQGVDAFVENVSSITKNMVTIESEFSFMQMPKPKQPISALSNDEKHELSILKRPIRYERKFDGTLVPCIVAPIIVDGEFYGNITCWAVNNEHVTMDLAILEKASSLLSLEFLKLKLKHDMEQQYKNDFMRELIFNEGISDENIIEWGVKYQLSKEKRYFCMLIGERLDNKNNIHHVIERSEVSTLLLEDYPQMLIGTIRNKLCLIIPLVEGEDEQSIPETIFERLKRHTSENIDLYSSVGEVFKGPKGIRKSFFQAEQAFKLKKMDKNSGDIVYYKKMGAYRLLGPLVGTRQFTDFHDETIGSLIKEDPKRELLETLYVYFEHNETIKGTSEALFIHVNTLKYRIKRIEQITGLDLKKTEDKVDLYLGLKIHDMKHYRKG